MDIRYKKLAQALTGLDKKAEELDGILQDVRVEINNVLWDLIEAGKNKELHNNHEK